MKNLTVLMLIIITLSSCDSINIAPADKYPKYTLSTMDYTPDSLIEKKAQFIVDVVDAASSKGMGGDYEDVDDTIEEAKRTANEIYTIEISCLHVDPTSKDYDDYDITPPAMTAYQKGIFEKLYNKGNLKIE